MASNDEIFIESVTPEQIERVYRDYKKLRTMAKVVNAKLDIAKNYLEMICDQNLTSLPSGITLIRNTIEKTCVDTASMPQEIKEEFQYISIYYTWEDSTISKEEMESLMTL